MSGRQLWSVIWRSLLSCVLIASTVAVLALAVLTLWDSQSLDGGIVFFGVVFGGLYGLGLSVIAVFAALLAYALNEKVRQARWAQSIASAVVSLVAFIYFPLFGVYGAPLLALSAFVLSWVSSLWTLRELDRPSPVRHTPAGPPT